MVRLDCSEIQNGRNPERDETIPCSLGFHSELAQVPYTLVRKDEIDQSYAPARFQYACHFAHHPFPVRPALKLMNHEVRNHRIEGAICKRELSMRWFRTSWFMSLRAGRTGNG